MLRDRCSRCAYYSTSKIIEHDGWGSTAVAYRVLTCPCMQHGVLCLETPPADCLSNILDILVAWRNVKLFWGIHLLPPLNGELEGRAD